MSFPEAFWALAGGAAPVIALAAVVALPDLQSAIEALYKAAHPDPEPGEERDPNEPLLPAFGLQTSRWRDRIRFWALMGNMVVQAVVLGLALASLEYRFSVVRPAVVIAAEVAGVLALAQTAHWISRARSLLTG